MQVIDLIEEFGIVNPISPNDKGLVGKDLELISSMLIKTDEFINKKIEIIVDVQVISGTKHIECTNDGVKASCRTIPELISVIDPHGFSNTVQLHSIMLTTNIITGHKTLYYRITPDSLLTEDKICDHGDSKNRNYHKQFKRVRMILGEPTIVVELTNEILEELYADAIDKFWLYSSKGNLIKNDKIKDKWIEAYFQANAKETLANIRGKYYMLPVPGSEVKFDWKHLLSSSMTDKKYLMALFV